MEKSPLKHKLLLDYKSIFPENTPPDITDYLSGINKSMLLQTATYFLGFKNQKSKYEDLKILFGDFFQTANKEFANDLYQRIRDFENRIGKKVMIFNAYSSLKLFEIVFNREDQVETKSNVQFERDVFIAYLLINQWQIENEDLAGKTTKELPFPLRFAMLTMCQLFPSFEITNHDLYDLWTTQTIKAISLFRFMESNESTLPVLNLFLEYFHCDTWQTYIKRYMPLTISAIKAEKEDNLKEFYSKGSLEVKQKIIGSIFPQNLVFNENGYRTSPINEAFRIITKTINDLQSYKKQNATVSSGVFEIALPPGLEPGTL